MNRPRRPPLLLLVAAGVLVMAIGVGLWRWSRFNTLWVVHGLGVKLEVALDGKVYPVGAQEKIEGVSAGTHLIEVKVNGVELERQLIYVRGGSKALFYNVGGTAPLLWERIAYTRNNTGSEPQWRMYCGARFIELDDPDYLFKSPPSTVSTKGGRTVFKTHVTLEPGGLKGCQAWAYEQGTAQMWAQWRVLEASVDPSKLYPAAEELARQGDFREAQRLIETAQAPSLDLKALHLKVLLASGQLARARERYGRSADDPQASDTELYLATLVLPSAERLPFLAAARRRFPASGWLAWLHARLLDREGRSAEAVAVYGLPGIDWPRSNDWYVTRNELSALLRAGRRQLAWDAASRAFAGTDNLDGALLLAQVAQATGHDADWSGKLKPGGLRWANALLDLPVTEPRKGTSDFDPEAFRRARQLIKVAYGGPAPALLGALPLPKKGKKAAALAPPPVLQQPAPQAALTMARSASDATLRALPEELVWALLAEAWRTADALSAAKLARFAATDSAPRLDSALRFIATEQTDLLLDNASDEVLAALWMARGRRLATLGASPASAYLEARRLDALRGVPTRLLDAWPEASAPSGKLSFTPVD